MSSIYDLYSPPSTQRRTFEDQLDSLQSVPDVGILDTIDAGIDSAGNKGWMLGGLNYVADKFPSVDNFLTGGAKRDRNLYDSEKLKAMYPDAPDGIFPEGQSMTLLRASTLYDQATADFRFQQALKIREAGSVSQFGYGIASAILDPQSLATGAMTAGASSLALGRFAPNVAQAVAKGGLKYQIGKDILDGTVATALFNAPTKIVAKDYFNDKYGAAEFAEEMAGNIAGAFTVHMGSSGLKKVGLWGLDAVMKRKILSEADARMAESMGDAYNRAASAFDEELAGQRTTTFTEDSARVYQNAQFTEARYSDMNGEFVFGFRSSSDPKGFRGTEPRFGSALFTGPETLIRASALDSKEIGMMYRVSLADANILSASPMTAPADAPAFFKSEMTRLSKEQGKIFKTAVEIYAEQGITVPKEVKNLNDLIKYSIEKVGDDFRAAEIILQNDLTGKGYGGISYMTSTGVEVQYLFDHTIKTAQDLEALNNSIALPDMTASRTKKIEHNPFMDEVSRMESLKSTKIGFDPFYGAMTQPRIGMGPIDTTTKSYNLQADGYLSNGKKIKLDPNGYFDTELLYESPENAQSITMDYVHTLSKEMIDDINRVVEEGSSRDITNTVKKYGLIPEKVKEQLMEIKLRQDFDATMDAERQAMAQANDIITFNRLEEKEQFKILKAAGLAPDSFLEYIELSKQLEKLESLEAESTAMFTQMFNEKANADMAVTPKSVDELTLEAVREKRLEVLDQKRAQIEKAMQKFAPKSKQAQALEIMLNDFEKEYLNVTMEDIEQAAKATKVCTSRN